MCTGCPQVGRRRVASRGRKHLHRSNKPWPQRQKTQHLANSRTALVDVLYSMNNYVRWKTFNQKAKFAINILVAVVISILIYQLIMDPQLSEHLFTEIVTNIIG